jgi:hypothetical protein
MAKQAVCHGYGTDRIARSDAPCRADQILDRGGAGNIAREACFSTGNDVLRDLAHAKPEDARLRSLSYQARRHRKRIPEAGVKQHDIGYRGLDLGDEVVLRICYSNESDTGLASQTIGDGVAVQSDATDQECQCRFRQFRTVKFCHSDLPEEPRHYIVTMRAPMAAVISRTI